MSYQFKCSVTYLLYKKYITGYFGVSYYKTNGVTAFIPTMFEVQDTLIIINLLASFNCKKLQ